MNSKRISNILSGTIIIISLYTLAGYWVGHIILGYFVGCAVAISTVILYYNYGVIMGQEFSDEEIKQAEKIMKYFKQEYQDKHPCPKCGSHNVHIDIDCIGGGNVAGSEWCDDCGWKEDTNTFTKKVDLLTDRMRYFWIIALIAGFLVFLYILFHGAGII